MGLKNSRCRRGHRLTVNDLPDNVLERFAPDLRPRTISNLRLVNRRFFQVFSADSFYRWYLIRPDCPELYLGDAQIGDVDRWRKCLAAEKLRLENWRNGNIARVDTVDLDELFSYPDHNRTDWLSWQGVKDGKEHWMMCQSRKGEIALLNVTDEPIMSLHDVSAFQKSQTHCQDAKLIPGQVLIKGSHFLHVFNLEKSNGRVSMQHLFKIEADDGYSINTHSGKTSLNGSYKNLCVIFQSARTDGVLKVWDVKRAVQMPILDLKQLLMHKCDFTEPQFDWRWPRLMLTNLEFPNVLVIINYCKERYEYSAIAVVNIEDDRLVYWFGELGCMSLECVSKGQMACVKLSMPHHSDDESTVIVFDLSKVEPIKRINVRKMCRDEAEIPAVRFRLESKEGCQILYEPSTLIIRKFRKNKLHMVCFDGRKVTQRKVNLKIDGYYFITCIIEPFFVVEVTSNKADCWFSVKAFDLFGTQLFDWHYSLSKRGIREEIFGFVRNINFQSLSKCVLSNRRGNKLYICYF